MDWKCQRRVNGSRGRSRRLSTPSVASLIDIGKDLDDCLIEVHRDTGANFDGFVESLRERPVLYHRDVMFLCQFFYFDSQKSDTLGDPMGRFHLLHFVGEGDRLVSGVWDDYIGFGDGGRNNGKKDADSQADLIADPPGPIERLAHVHQNQTRVERKILDDYLVADKCNH